MKAVWLHSTNDEWWCCYDEFDSRDDAIDAGAEEYEGGSFYTGRREALFFGDAVSFEDLAEGATEHFYDLVGEGAQDYAPMANDEAREKLRTFLNDWATEYNIHPKFFSVVDVEKHTPGKEQ